MSILKIDDLITETPKFELENKQFTFNTSLKTILKYQKWAMNNLDANNEEVYDDENVEKLLQIIIENNEELISIYRSLNGINKFKVINRLINHWNSLMGLNSPSGNETEKK